MTTRIFIHFLTCVGLILKTPISMAATISVPPVANGWGQDRPLGGVYDLLITDSSAPLFVFSHPMETEIRSALEFNISSIPKNSLINSATFSFTTTVLVDNSAKAETLGYFGDGLITLADMTIAARSLDVQGPISFGITRVDVTSFIQSALNAAQPFVGLRLQPITVAPDSGGFDPSSLGDPNSSLHPNLTVNFTSVSQPIPEPSMLLSLFGIASTAFLSIVSKGSKLK